jgi:hypothetical protein
MKAVTVVDYKEESHCLDKINSSNTSLCKYKKVYKINQLLLVRG